MPLAVSLTNILDLQGGLIGLSCPQCLCVSLSHYISSCLQCCSFWITALGGSLLWLPYLQLLLLCWSYQITALVVDFANLGQGSFQVADKYLHWSFFSVMVLVAGHLQGWFLLTRLPWKLLAAPCIFAGPLYQPLMAPVPKLIYWARV